MEQTGKVCEDNALEHGKWEETREERSKNNLHERDEKKKGDQE